MRIASCLLFLLMGTAAAAQVPGASDRPPRPVLSLELRAGEPVQVLREDALLEGRLLETTAHFLTLGLDLSKPEYAQLPLADVQALSVRKRSVGHGALIGAGVGFLGGGLAGLYLCRIPDNISTGECAFFVGGAAGISAALSAGLGAFIGFLIPRWERVYERVLHGLLVVPSLRAPEELWREEPSGVRVGQIRLYASNVLTIAEPQDALGAGARIQALAQLGANVAVGPEVAVHYLFEPLGGNDINDLMASFGVLMRAAPRPSVLTPSLLVGFSLHTAGQPATYSVGVGLDWEEPEGVPLAFELRWHQFNVPWKDGRQLTLGIGTRFFW